MLLLFPSIASADSDYSLGMKAYIEGDFRSARSHWLKSAKDENPRAMFNLGLLHDQKKLPNPDPAKADRWFRLAAQQGYAAADFHYAMRLIEKQRSVTEAQTHLQRAANNGYVPAQKKLAEMANERTLVTGSAGADGAPVGTDSGDGDLTYLSEEWILSRQGDAWTIQLLAFENESKVREFVDLHRLHDRAAYFIAKDGSKSLYKLVYGAFQNKQQATQAREALTPALQEHGPWLRTLASVQEVIRN